LVGEANRIHISVESEYRFTLSRDGLWGFEVFLNGVLTADPATGVFSIVDPGVGAGIRIKFDKETSANLSIDYGWGAVIPMGCSWA